MAFSFCFGEDFHNFECNMVHYSTILVVIKGNQMCAFHSIVWTCASNCEWWGVWCQPGHVKKISLFISSTWSVSKLWMSLHHQRDIFKSAEQVGKLKKSSVGPWLSHSCLQIEDLELFHCALLVPDIKCILSVSPNGIGHASVLW
ncbi:Hypothetical predicted protein [Podarcis lilfordi]|uniref:Uncharacterized protein n=1 Tax=Podarcis lilfordi TaxID=74358 RepID=A0AA35KCT8_9SAUR|nr:Hypothetical predicted protein [Podarcis lilfordi]